MVPEDICKAAIAIPLGNYEFLRMSMVLGNAFRMFQRFLYNVLEDNLPFCSVFIDDIIVFSTSELEHKDQVLFFVNSVKMV